MKAKDLKNSILQMAVQGKLVPQDPSDEPASVLLKRIREQKRKLVAEGKVKAPKGGESIVYRASDGSHYEKRIDAKGRESEPICIDDEIPFEIPESWEWARLETIVNIVSARRVHQSDWTTSGIPFYRAREIVRLSHGEHVEQPLCISEDLFNKLKASGCPQAGDLMVTGVGTIGTTYIVQDNDLFYYKDASVLCFENRFGADSVYLSKLMDSPYMLEQVVSASSGTTVATITMKNAVRFLLPIPPLNEQARITNRLDVITPYLDKYGYLEDEREALDAALPDQLRKSILQQAVEGRLVPQNSSDEPASVLLKRIREQKRKLAAEGKVKALKGGESIIYRSSDGGYYEKFIDAKGRESDPVCIDDEIPVTIPESWAWARLDSLVALDSGLGYKKSDLAVTVDTMVRVLRGGNIPISDDAVLLQDNDVFIAEQFVDSSLFLHEGQIITPAVTSLENVGKAALIHSDMPNTVCGGFVFFLTPYLKDQLFSEYLFCYLTSPVHKTYCKASVKKSGQAFYNLSKASLNTALVAVAPRDEQRRIVRKCESLLGCITNQ